MAVKIPLVLSAAGEVQRLQAGDTIAAGSATLNQHVVSSDYTITAGSVVYVPRYIEISAGISVGIDADGDLEIG